MAFARWLEEKARLDTERAKQPKPFHAEYEQAISEWMAVCQWCDSHDESELANRARTTIAKLQHRLISPSPTALEWDDRFLNRFEIPPETLSGILGS